HHARGGGPAARLRRQLHHVHRRLDRRPARARLRRLRPGRPRVDAATHAARARAAVRPRRAQGQVSTGATKLPLAAAAPVPPSAGTSVTSKDPERSWSLTLSSVTVPLVA